MENTCSFQQKVKVYKALGEPTRMKIVELLCRHTELSCTELLSRLGLTAGSTISHHLKLLQECELLQLRKRGTFHYYSVRQDLLRQLAPVIMDAAGSMEHG